MDYHDAVIASEYLHCQRIVGCHYDSFGFIKIDHAAAQAAFAEKGKELVLMNIGGSLEI